MLVLDMVRIIVSVGTDFTGAYVDVEVPADLPSGELAYGLADVLYGEWLASSTSSGFLLYASPPGRIIPAEMTLTDFGVWDGALLIIQRPVTAYFESGQGSRYLCPGREFWIGRRTTSSELAADETPLLDVSNEPNSNTVSRRHAWVVWETENWRIYPARQARNLIIVNGKQLASDGGASLRDGDEVRFGAVRLWFRIGVYLATPPA